MGTRLHVANLPHAPSAAALRAHFGRCGDVAEVEIVADRNPGSGRAAAFVRMVSEAGARRALDELDRSAFGGQILSVEQAPNGASSERRDAKRDKEQQSEADAAARITLQFREPSNMTYELDCGGTTLVLRVFFQTEPGEWRIVAQGSSAEDAPSAASTSVSRLESLRNIANACREGAVATLGRIDWGAVERAMTKVRAV